MIRRFVNEKGFSLVELVTVVAIIAILGAIAVPSWQNLSNKTKAGIVREDMQTAILSAKMLQLNGKTLVEALENGGCTMCGGNVARAWQLLGYPSIPRDPWGHDYIIDENEGEFGTNDCRYDAIYSHGPDGRFDGVGDGDDVYGDDIVVRIPRKGNRTFRCPGDPLDDQFGSHIY